ncbi:MAG TPA: hypothetical protein VOA87_06735 [Thermoanaerobaculia bacterium]|nr:hypothetical protein [Thermoanaerobaculia bacterium]
MTDTDETPPEPTPEFHPPDEALLNYLGSLPIVDAGLLLHMLQCRRCGNRARLDLQPAAGASGVRRLARFLGVDYSGVLTRREGEVKKTAALLKRRQAAAEPLIAKVMATPPDRRVEELREVARVDPWAVGWAFLRASREALPGNPGRAESLARLAGVAIEEMDPVQHPAGLSEAFLAEALCQVAEACRLRGDLAQAEEELGRATEHLIGATDSTERADLSRFLARLRRDQRRWDEALALFGRASDLLSSLGRLYDAAEALAEKGEVELWMLDPDEALETFSMADSLLPQNPPTGLVLRIHQGIARSYAYQNRFARAWQDLAAVRRRFALGEDTVEGLALTLLDGELAEGEGEVKVAEERLWRAWQGLFALGEPHLAAIAAIQLARLLLTRDRADDFAELASLIAPIFDAKGLHPSLLAALAVFRTAVRKGKVTVPLATAVLNHLKIGLSNPSLSFRAPAVA